MTKPGFDQAKGPYVDRTQIRRRALMLIPIIVCVHLGLDLVYRDWVREYGWNDWGLASSFTQITAILGIACLMILIELKPTETNAPPLGFFVVVPMLAMLGYEVLQIWLPATFDVQDIGYCLIGGILNWAMLRFIVFRKPSSVGG